MEKKKKKAFLKCIQEFRCFDHQLPRFLAWCLQKIHTFLHHNLVSVDWLYSAWGSDPSLVLQHCTVHQKPPGEFCSNIHILSQTSISQKISHAAIKAPASGSVLRRNGKIHVLHSVNNYIFPESETSLAIILGIKFL